MKIKYVMIIIFICGFSFAQGNKSVFEFNSSTDKILYRNLNGKQKVSGFNILIGKQTKFFSASPCLGKKPLKINVNRIVLTKEVENDNINKKKNYVIFVRSINEYYTVDHIVRKIEN